MSPKQAPNIQAILDWCEANRPDLTGHIERIAAPSRIDGNAEAMLLLLTIGFAAGRQYQIDHPEHGALSFHTDPPVLHRPPVKSTDG